MIKICIFPNRVLVRGETFYLKTRNVTESVIVCQLISGRGIGGTFYLVEPEYVTELYGLRLIVTETSLIPFEFDMRNGHQNEILDGVLTLEKNVASFFKICKPQFERVGLTDGCGNEFCDGIHSLELNKKCPAISGSGPEACAMTVVLRINEHKIKFCSASLARYFCSSTLLAVSSNCYANETLFNMVSH